ncbi:MAG: family 1 glycosylhydrolase [Anaerolineae bacterium]|nr:family 1 glycosylhydrolase [Anaerolineae bacterium]
MNTIPSTLRMPPGFRWGVATAAHQNEGDNHNNQWSAWEQQPGRIHQGQHSGKATDWWNLDVAAADFDRAAELGLNSIRLSVEWSRIEPEPGVFDASTLRQYAEMLRLLRQRGLEPMVTLHHFTDPLWLTEIGGWENPLVEDYFSRFTARVVEALGDQVTLWCTINEPLVYAVVGYLDGRFPPGVKNIRRAMNVLRRMLLAHGRAYRAIHRLQNHAHAGLAHHMRVHLPANPANAADRRAAAMMNQIANRSTLAAITEGKLTPLLGLGQTATHLIDTSDFIGLNYYTTILTTFDPTQPGNLFARTFFDPAAEFSDYDSAGDPYGIVDPAGLYLALKTLASYSKPIYITENGMPGDADDMRGRFIATHLAEAWRAQQEGADVRGYYHWTLVDNFEWVEAWNLKFGLFSLDRETGARTPKPSAAIYAQIAQANGVPARLLETLAPGYLARLEAGN